MHSVIGILAALRHLEATGQGQHVETNLLATAMSSLVNQTSAYVAGGVVPHRMGNAHLSLFPYEPLQTGDGELIIVAGNGGQYRKLVTELGAPELADDDRFATVGSRNDNREELRPLLLDLLLKKTAQEWFDHLSGAGIPCGPINDVRGGVELAERLGLNPRKRRRVGVLNKSLKLGDNYGTRLQAFEMPGTFPGEAGVGTRNP